MLLAGDIGGTKTLLGLYVVESPRPRAVTVRSFATLEHDDLASIITEFIRERPAGHFSSSAFSLSRSR